MIFRQAEVGLKIAIGTVEMQRAQKVVAVGDFHAGPCSFIADQRCLSGMNRLLRHPGLADLPSHLLQTAQPALRLAFGQLRGKCFSALQGMLRFIQQSWITPLRG